MSCRFSDEAIRREIIRTDDEEWAVNLQAILDSR